MDSATQETQGFSTLPKPLFRGQPGLWPLSVHLAWMYSCPERLALLKLTSWSPGCLEEHVEDLEGKSSIFYLDRD